MPSSTSDQRPATSDQYEISPVGIAAQELVLAGGLENWVRSKLNLF